MFWWDRQWEILCGFDKYTGCFFCSWELFYIWRLVMDALKEASIKRIKQMPDGTSLENIMYEINFIGQVLEGIKDADEGKVVSTSELLKEIGSWGK